MYKITLCLFLSLFTFVTTKVQAQAYEEESYEDLVQRLNQQRNHVAQQSTQKLEPNMLDDITLHAGAALVTSSFTVREFGNLKQFNMDGFQLSAGVDLFSPNFVAEGAIRNFGSQTDGTDSHSFREVDLKAMYRSPGHGSEIGTRVGLGIATRYMSISNMGFSSDESNPAAIVFGGLEASFSKNFAIGLELGYRQVLATNTTDQSSTDLMLRMDGFF